MSSAPSVPGVEVGASWLGGCGQVLTAMALELPAALHRMLGPATVLVIELYGPRIVATTRARMGEPMAVACIAHVLGAPIQGVPVGRHFADELAGSGRRVRHSTRSAALTR